uniref:Pyridine nucleotide-disulfide oxidoreductase domain-containing protein 1 n=1 Tax=Culicoides sonorensis TaxID=179676 RepID=A0A336K4F7_CULSO
MQHSLLECTCLIVGGGIAGTSCLESLAFLSPKVKIIILTESPLIKSVINVSQLTKTLHRFDIEEKQANSLANEHIIVIQDCLVRIEHKTKQCFTSNGIVINYEFLCLCSGARPKLIEQSNKSPLVIGIRDTDTVFQFEKYLEKSKCLAIVGNGGIASDIVHEIKDVKVHWVIKDNYVSSTFLDEGAAKFFQDSLFSDKNKSSVKYVIKRMRYTEDNQETNSQRGAALGPDWHRNFNLTGRFKNISSQTQITLHKNCEVEDIVENVNSEHPLTLKLSNNTKIECDLIISATGVTPRIDYETDVPFKYGPDGGIFVDEFMQTSIPSIYAAGDVCYAGWNLAPNFFQMRLWTQARQMGSMAGKSISSKLNNEPVISDFCFELFGHITQLFGYQVVLLGNYNGQKLNNEYEIILRVTPNKEFIKFVLKDGRLQGAMLIGETDLAETCENLILNQLDLSSYGTDILDPNIDIEDYFD